MKFNKLVGLRAEYGYSQQNMADYLHISKMSYYAKENDRQQFVIGEIEAILLLFNKKYEEVFKR